MAKIIQKDICILECPTNLGLIKPPHADEPGVKKLPDWLRKWGFHSAIKPKKIVRAEAPDYTMEIDPVTQVRNAGRIAEYAIAQSETIVRESDDNTFLLLLGGDCSVLIGSALALKQKGNYGLFYLDGHTDYIKPEQSNTHGAAGMDLAIACGFGHSDLTNIKNTGPYIAEQNVFCVGNREYDVAYEAPVIQSQVNYIPLNKLREAGIENIVTQFLSMVETQHLDGFFIHFDVDVLEDSIMPAVDSRQTDGLSYRELEKVLQPLLVHNLATGMEITILDPDLDPDGVYTVEFVRNVVDIIDKHR